MRETSFTWLEKYLQEPIRRTECVDTGWDHTVYVLDERWVLRVPKEHMTFNREEEKLLRDLRIKAGVMLPAFRIVKTPAGKEAMLYPYIQGNPITRNLAAICLEDAASQLGSFLTSLHSIDISLYRLPKRDWGYYDELLEKIRCFYPKLPASITSYTEDLFAELQPVCTAVVHGDISPAHVLWDESSAKVGIIDFTDAHIGDPAIDFAGIGQISENFRDMVLLNYDAADKKLILQRSDQLAKLGLYYELLAEGPSRELVVEMETRFNGR